jgi:hypothetical protein
LQLFLYLACFTSPVAFAQDAPLAVNSIADVHGALDAKKSDGDIAAAIQASSAAFLPRHLHELVDREASDTVKRAMATKSATFYSGNEKSLNQLAIEGRKYQTAEKMKLTGDDIVILFEFFGDIKHEKESATAGVSAPQPLGAGELEREFDLRKRAYDEAVVRATAPIEGKLEAASFDVEVAGEWEDLGPNGCTKAKAVADMSAVDFFLFREAMGTLQVRSEVKTKTKTVQSLAFEGAGTRRIEAVSKKVCVSESELATLRGSGVKLWVEMRRTVSGDDWTGPAEFVNAKTNSRIQTSR